MSPYITYFSIGYRLWTFGIKFSLTDQRNIDGAVKEWRKRLRVCAAAEGGQSEHEL